MVEDVELRRDKVDLTAELVWDELSFIGIGPYAKIDHY